VRSRDLSIPIGPISELTLGTWGLCGDAYGAVSDTEQDQVIVRARALGISAFETADVYAHGEMESRLGRLLGSDTNVTLITKIGTDRTTDPPRKSFQVDYLRRAIESSATRLKREVDLVLLHNPSADTLRNGLAPEKMRQWSSEGLMRSWGVSAGSAEVAEAALDAQAPAIQLAFNCFWDSDFKRIVERVREKQTLILARSVLAHGLLCGLWPEDKTFPEHDHRARRWAPDELRRRVHQVQALRLLVRGDVHTPRSAAIRWVLNHPEVSTVVVGPRSAQQLDQLVREMGKGPPYLPDLALVPFEMRLLDLGVRQ
jgi:aryl-alcohol dehydrogenase-like predicted oxidoreductase